jgi:molybdenum cofactor guanylyltransferase
MRAAGLLLTGGASRRMGRDKATLTLTPAGESLAGRTARLLAAVTSPAFEVGPGHSQLPAIAEGQPGAGPLAAVAAGRRALCAFGWEPAAGDPAALFDLGTPADLAQLGAHR